MFKLRKVMTLVMVACIFATFSGFTNSVGASKGNDSVYPMKIVDAYKNVITIDKEPQRIISVAPSITEIVYSLEKSNKLVGRTDYCTYPKAATSIQSIGKIVNPSIEKIVDLKPDLVIASNLLDKETIKKLGELNIKVLVMSGVESFNGVYDTINTLGNVLNANVKAKSIIRDMKYKVDVVSKIVKNAKKPSVYYVVAYGKMGDYTATGDTFIGNMIEMAGGVNAAKDGSNWKYSIEKLVQKNPDILVCSKYYDTKKSIAETPGYKDLKAVKNRKLLEIDDNLLSIQGPRIADGVYKLAALIHPELFK